MASDKNEANISEIKSLLVDVEAIGTLVEYELKHIDHGKLSRADRKKITDDRKAILGDLSSDQVSQIANFVKVQIRSLRDSEGADISLEDLIAKIQQAYFEQQKSMLDKTIDTVDSLQKDLMDRGYSEEELAAIRDAEEAEVEGLAKDPKDKGAVKQYFEENKNKAKLTTAYEANREALGIEEEPKPEKKKSQRGMVKSNNGIFQRFATKLKEAYIRVTNIIPAVKTRRDKAEIEASIAAEDAQIGKIETELRKLGFSVNEIDDLISLKESIAQIENGLKEGEKSEEQAKLQDCIAELKKKGVDESTLDSLIDSLGSSLTAIAMLQVKEKALEERTGKKKSGREAEGEHESVTEFNDSEAGRNTETHEETSETHEEPSRETTEDGTSINYGVVSEKQQKELDAFFEENKNMLLSETELKQDLFKGQFKRYGTMTRGGKVVPFMHFSFDSEQPIPGDEANKRNVVVTFIVTPDGIKRLTSLPEKVKDVSQVLWENADDHPENETGENDGSIVSLDSNQSTKGTNLVEMEYLKKSDKGNYSYMKTTETGTMTINMGKTPLKSRTSVIELNAYAEARKKEALETLDATQVRYKDASGNEIKGDAENKEVKARIEALQKYLDASGISKDTYKSPDLITSGTGSYTRNESMGNFSALSFMAFTYNKEKPELGPLVIDISEGLDKNIKHTKYVKCKDGYIDPETVTFDDKGTPSKVFKLEEIITEAKSKGLNASFMDRVMKQQRSRKPIISREDKKIAETSRLHKNQPVKGPEDPSRDDADRDDL